MVLGFKYETKVEDLPVERKVCLLDMIKSLNSKEVTSSKQWITDIEKSTQYCSLVLDRSMALLDVEPLTKKGMHVANNLRK